MLGKYTRSDCRVGEHIADASSRNAEKSRGAEPGDKTEDQEDLCEGKCLVNYVYNRGKGKGNPPSPVPMS
jgi:hypothetical protein